MSWYLAPSLAVLRSEVNTRWPDRDRTSDGTIGDANHQARDSDHNPNERESVDAWDMDKDGVNVAEVLAAFERHPSAHYWIWQRQIADRDTGWQRRAYGGTNPHTAHVHFSIRQSATAEQNRQAWGLLESDMATEIEELVSRARYMDSRLDAWAKGRDTIAAGFPAAGTSVWGVVFLKAMSTKQDLANAKLDAILKGVDTVDDKVAAALDAQLDELDSAITAAEAADAQRDAAVAAKLTTVPLDVFNLLQTVPANEAANTLVSGVGKDRARAIAQAVLNATA